MIEVVVSVLPLEGLETKGISLISRRANMWVICDWVLVKTLGSEAWVSFSGWQYYRYIIYLGWKELTLSVTLQGENNGSSMFGPFLGSALCIFSFG